MKKFPIIRRNEGIADGPCNRRGARVHVVSVVPRTSPTLVVASDDFILQDPQGLPLLDHNEENITTHA